MNSSRPCLRLGLDPALQRRRPAGDHAERPERLARPGPEVEPVAMVGDQAVAELERASITLWTGRPVEKV